MSMDPTELPSAGTSSSEQEDAQPLLGTRCLGSRTCGDTPDRVREDEGVLQRQQDARRRIYLRLKAEQRGERATCAAYTLISRRMNGMSPPVE